MSDISSYFCNNPICIIMSDDSGFSESQNSSVAVMDSCIWVTVSLLDLQYDLCAAWCTHISCMSKWTPVCFEAPFIIFVSSFSNLSLHFLSVQQTALHWSAFYNRPEHVRLLIKHDSNIGIPDSEGKIPLHWAAHSQEPSATQTVRCILVYTIVRTHTLSS